MNDFGPRDLATLGLIFIAGLLGFMANSYRADAAEARESALTAEDSIAALLPILAAETARADTAQELALSADTVLVRITDSVTIVVREAIESADLSDAALGSRLDSLRVIVATVPDSVIGLRLIDDVEADHDATRAEEVRARQAIEVQLGATDASRALWQASDSAKAVVIATQSALIAEQDVAIEGWRRAANPPLLQKLVGMVPEVGGTLLIVGVVLLAR